MGPAVFSHFSPHQSEKKNENFVLFASHLSGLHWKPVGIGTAYLLAVAGLHRASPSTSLDKSFNQVY